MSPHKGSIFENLQLPATTGALLNAVGPNGKRRTRLRRAVERSVQAASVRRSHLKSSCMGFWEHYQQRYGFWCPAIDAAVERFLEYGHPQHGFARVRCLECACEFAWSEEIDSKVPRD